MFQGEGENLVTGRRWGWHVGPGVRGWPLVPEKQAQTWPLGSDGSSAALLSVKESAESGGGGGDGPRDAWGTARWTKTGSAVLLLERFFSSLAANQTEG